MQTKRGRIDRFLAKAMSLSLREVKLLIAQRRVQVDGGVIDHAQFRIDEFSTICVDQEIIQQNHPVYIVLHKPKGVICATQDAHQQTVLALIDHPKKDQLHIVGRLDKNSTGLVLLTNDSRWSQRINDQQQKIGKTYEVRVQNPITSEMITAFEQGIYFTTEQRHSKPAQLKILTPVTAEVVLTEGMYHQIKRMFGHFRNPVLSIHRIAIGQLKLTAALPEHAWLELNAVQAEALLSQDN